MPYGPARAGHNGNIVTFNSLSNNGGSFERGSTTTEGPRERLLKVIDTIQVNTLEADDAVVFRAIDRDAPWLLTPREIDLLKRFSKN